MKYIFVLAALVAVGLTAESPYQILMTQIQNMIAIIEDPSTSPAVVAQTQSQLHDILVGHFPPNDPIAAMISQQVLGLPAPEVEPVHVVDAVEPAPVPVPIVPAPSELAPAPVASASSPLVQLIININSANSESAPAEGPSPVAVGPAIVPEAIAVSPAITLPAMIPSPAAGTLPA